MVDAKIDVPTEAWFLTNVERRRWHSPINNRYSREYDWSLVYRPPIQFQPHERTFLRSTTRFNPISAVRNNDDLHSAWQVTRNRLRNYPETSETNRQRSTAAEFRCTSHNVVSAPIGSSRFHSNVISSLPPSQLDTYSFGHLTKISQSCMLSGTGHLSTGTTGNRFLATRTYLGESFLTILLERRVLASSLSQKNVCHIYVTGETPKGECRIRIFELVEYSNLSLQLQMSSTCSWLFRIDEESSNKRNIKSDTQRFEWNLVR